ncbi:hypothetical protein [Corynebacterium glutamicum]|uniref:hypothetical protein n=1 Tax=Corynebacterium glutamicum TaxID=1718 RepID=UPI00155F25D8|nr:hypothetical protein [Corynebacterium glutamicum]
MAKSGCQLHSLGASASFGVRVVLRDAAPHAADKVEWRSELELLMYEPQAPRIVCEHLSSVLP